jgi:hypothetical protein
MTKITIEVSHDILDALQMAEIRLRVIGEENLKQFGSSPGLSENAQSMINEAAALKALETEIRRALLAQ